MPLTRHTTPRKLCTLFYKHQNSHFVVDRNSQAPEQSPITSQQHNQGEMGN